MSQRRLILTSISLFALLLLLPILMLTFPTNSNHREIELNTLRTRETRRWLFLVLERREYDSWATPWLETTEPPRWVVVHSRVIEESKPTRSFGVMQSFDRLLTTYHASDDVRRHFAARLQQYTRVHSDSYQDAMQRISPITMAYSVASSSPESMISMEDIDSWFNAAESGTHFDLARAILDSNP